MVCVYVYTAGAVSCMIIWIWQIKSQRLLNTWEALCQVRKHSCVTVRASQWWPRGIEVERGKRKLRHGEPWSPTVHFCRFLDSPFFSLFLHSAFFQTALLQPHLLHANQILLFLLPSLWCHTRLYLFSCQLNHQWAVHINQHNDVTVFRGRVACRWRMLSKKTDPCGAFMRPLLCCPPSSLCSCCVCSPSLFGFFFSLSCPSLYSTPNL